MGVSASLQRLRLRIWVTLFRALTSRKQGPFLLPPDQTRRKFVKVPSRDAGRAIDAWLYYPDDYSVDFPSSALPVLINWHGSGFVNLALGLDHEYCSYIARTNNMLVLDADYRKAPENPWPAPVEDMEDVLAWVSEQQATMDLSRVALSGFSSGGFLALIAASSLRTNYPKLNIQAVVTIYAGTDIAADNKTKTVPHPVRAIPPWVLDIFFDSYAPPHVSREDPRVSPFYADPGLFPSRVTMVNCSGDILRPEADALADKLKAAGCQVQVVCLENMPHGFDKGCEPNTPEWEKKEYTYKLVADSLKEALV
ncbi:hypothetical protein jhhlp_002784 [Lomentospora prolificans]|uniref:Alpha/beta hydrolase fold-3 domain-containing protein n=1 Tax=Lomentospora prolificans TaxID=41688 RepID=A0A2N3MZT1_9PEZI|nr:hypothetical protein jhhlp_007955 [Lomentospora prolificans]PKS05706.1 hypothetical protein jhhlp_007950 [Lomentospora prolificans]PKS11025.1 hypothetical protein jhhlp_002784 [Lomentospora prolificans]